MIKTNLDMLFGEEMAGRLREEAEKSSGLGQALQHLQYIGRPGPESMAAIATFMICMSETIEKHRKALTHNFLNVSLPPIMLCSDCPRQVNPDIMGKKLVPIDPDSQES